MDYSGTIMKHFNNFKLYEPDDKKLPTALYLRDNKGNDWYSVIESFSPDTFKISYRDDGIIIACEKDASGLFPVNLSVVEVADTDIPDGFQPGNFTYSNGVIAPVQVDYVALATAERDRRSAAVTARINKLVEAQDDGDITSDELTELATLREVRTKLRRLDLSKAPDINWPDM